MQAWRWAPLCAACLIALLLPPLEAQQSQKLAYVISNLYGPEGLTLDNDTHRAHFDSSFRENFSPFNTALAAQLTSLPLPSTAAGFTYTYDPTLGIYNRSAQSFGPILAERAETIGKGKFYVGFSISISVSTPSMVRASTLSRRSLLTAPRWILPRRISRT